MNVRGSCRTLLLPSYTSSFKHALPFFPASSTCDLHISAAYINALFALCISDLTPPQRDILGGGGGGCLPLVLYSTQKQGAAVLGVQAGTSWVGFPTPTESFRRSLGSTAGVSPLQDEKYMVLPYTSHLHRRLRIILRAEVLAERLAGNKRNTFLVFLSRTGYAADGAFGTTASADFTLRPSDKTEMEGSERSLT